MCTCDGEIKDQSYVHITHYTVCNRQLPLALYDDVCVRVCALCGHYPHTHTCVCVCASALAKETRDSVSALQNGFVDTHTVPYFLLSLLSFSPSVSGGIKAKLSKKECVSAASLRCVDMWS